MKKITVFMLAASLLLAVACEDKEEEVFEKVSNEIDLVKQAENESDDLDEDL
ncbi:MAG: hypothetical protein ABJF04_06820 [Reichenbachiella sp.]|uniref:hypothetical protein n=1 Tax=Reichenbachiella sp. TaxID=2184521 RepID=UPI0032652B9F